MMCPIRPARSPVVYRFETKGGKPADVRRVKNDFLKDGEFTACIV